MTSSCDKSTEGAGWLPLVVLLLLVVIIWAGSGWLLYSSQERGTLGDMFGAVNALFAGLAFASLIYTIHLQRHELKLQRIELAETRKELNGQRLELEGQNKLKREENFESSFFRVIGILAEIVRAMSVERKNGQYLQGRDCFEYFYEYISSKYSRVTSPSNEDGQICDVASIYQDFYQRYQGDVGHYFRTLYSLVKLVDRSDIQDKRFYTNLVRAQLSSNELLMLFYNCTSSLGAQKFKPLVERYALLKTMPFESLLNPEHKRFYESGAYGEA